MILILAPAGNITFASMPSGSTYVSDQDGIIKVTNNSVADQQALITAGCKTLSPIPGSAATTQTGPGYTIQSTDQNNEILFTNNSAVTVTLPNSFAVGFVVTLFQLGTGTVTASAQSGGSVVTPNLHNTPNQYSSLVCIVVSNSSGTNAVWDVIAEPLQNDGVVGASDLTSLYTQDTSAHYAQYTIAQVLNDGASANNGTWLKTGTGNGLGNWTQESTLTLAGLNNLITALQAQVTANSTAIAQAAKAVPAQQVPTNMNAIRGRFTQTSDIAGAEGDYKSLSSYQIRLYRSYQTYNDNVYQTFGEPQALVISDNNPAGGAEPIGGYWISVADLEAAGIIPGPSTYISAQIAIDIASAVNQTLDGTANNSHGQCAIILRYAGVGASQELYHNVTPYDLWFLNANSAKYNNVTLTDPNYIGVYSSSVVTTGNVKGYVWNKLALPATYLGLALTGIAIICYGNTTTPTTPTSFQICLASVVAGNSIVSGQAYFNTDDKPATYVPQANVVNILDAASADKIIVLGDSIGGGFYQPVNKAWPCKVSLESDWNVENYSFSGYTYQQVLNQILLDTTNVNSFPFGQTSFRDYKGSRVLLMCEGNDVGWETQAQFLNDLKTTAKVCRDFGLVPTVCGEFLNLSGFFPNGIQTLMRSAAEDLGVDHLDLRRHGKLFAPASQNAREFFNPHPGVRSNHLHADPVLKYIKGIDGPRKSFKIFRKRAFVSAGSAPYDALMFDGHYERAALFKEINIGHDAMLTNEQYCDDLTAQSGNYATGSVESEYLQLRSGFSISFADFGLIEACFPETPDEVRLVLSDPNISVYVKDVLATPYPTTLNRFQAFVPTGSPSITVGATYTSSDGGFGGQTFTFAGTWNGLLMFTPAVKNKTNMGSGTLTKTSGIGDATVGYSSSVIGFDPQYYTWYGLPPGHWTQVTGVNGVYTLSVRDLRSKVRRNKVSFLLYEASGFYLSAPRIMYRTSQRKAIEERKTYYRGQSEFRPARGSELLTHNYTNSMTGWTVTGSLTPGAPADAQMPTDPATGSSMTQCVQIDSTDYLSQAFSWTASFEDDLEAEVTVYARNFPSLANPATITSDTFDYAQLEVDIVTANSVTAAKIERVGLWWNELKFRTILPLGETSATLVMKPVGSVNTIQIAYASVKLVNV